jgi:hypothetical protein
MCTFKALNPFGNRLFNGGETGRVGPLHTTPRKYIKTVGGRKRFIEGYLYWWGQQTGYMTVPCRKVYMQMERRITW